MYYKLTCFIYDADASNIQAISPGVIICTLYGENNFINWYRELQSRKEGIQNRYIVITFPGKYLKCRVSFNKTCGTRKNSGNWLIIIFLHST